jgi:GNAT superfamily N-acetyltransferase
VGQIRALYDQQQRIDIRYPGTRREATEHVVRVIEPERGAVIYSRLDAANADAVIAGEIAHFKALGIAANFEWKVFGHDQPADLRERLIRHGFEVTEPADAVMVLDLKQLPPKLAQPVTHDVRRITDERGLADLHAVIDAVWPDDDHSASLTWKASLLRDTPEAFSFYVAYVQDQPVSEGWIDFPDTDFAGLWGGATLSEYRNQGLYTAVVAVRAQEAQRRGYRFLAIDASPMSRAVLEKQGFVVIASAWECNYRGESAAR